MIKTAITFLALVGIFLFIGPVQAGKPRTDVSDLFPEIASKKVGNEIELKFRLDVQLSEKFKHFLSNYPGVQNEGVDYLTDTYYNNPDKTFFFERTDTKGNKFEDFLRSVRIRRQIFGNHSVNTKLRHVDEAGKTLSRDEYERDVSAQEIAEFDEKWSSDLGYTQKIVIEKVRKKYVYKDFEIVFDVFKDITGPFFEIELKREDVSVSQGMKIIYDFLSWVGIIQLVQYDCSYLHMLMNPEYDFGREINLEQ